jgi:glycosyltransferase involved in cell wall biosynthesis
VTALSSLEPTPSAVPGEVLVDIALPVFNEAHVLGESVDCLCAYLDGTFTFPWRITIVDNASTDETLGVAHRLARSRPRVDVVHLDAKGRGRALKAAWSASSAPVLVYMDIDLSTGLDALLPLVAPVISGHSDIVVGSRRLHGARVRRSAKRELISRAYNLLVGLTLRTRVHDAQCGFKAISGAAAQQLLPYVTDDGWFFDTELLALAQHTGLRVLEIPVDWIEDPDSRVDLWRTALDDLVGIARVRRARRNPRLSHATRSAPLSTNFGDAAPPPDSFARITRNPNR